MSIDNNFFWYPALLFPAIPIMLLVFTNKYTALAMLIRKLHVMAQKDEIENLEHIVLKLGEISTAIPVMVRMHKLNVYKDLLGLVPTRYNEIGRAMQKIIANKNGLLVILSASDNNSEKTNSDTLKEYGIGAQILSLLGVKKIKLL